jgi:hypothetical protein
MQKITLLSLVYCKESGIYIPYKKLESRKQYDSDRSRTWDMFVRHNRLSIFDPF